MKVIEVFPSPNDLYKLCKRVTSFRQPGFIGCQVAGNNVRGRRWPYLTGFRAGFNLP